MLSRLAIGLLVMSLLFPGCTKAPINYPAKNSDRNSASPDAVESDVFAVSGLETGSSEIVLILSGMTSEASDLMGRGDLLAAHQVFEDALDIITLFEDDNTDEFSPEYLEIKQRIHDEFRDLLRQEDIDLHETSLEILLEEINITEEESEVTAASTVSPIGEFPMPMNKKVLQAISYFEKGKGRASMEVWLQRAGKYLPLIKQIFAEEGLPPELVYLCFQESGLRPTVVSYARAVGMWQFIAATGKNYDLKITPYVDERMDPVKSTRAAAKHLKDLYNHWDKDWHIALAAYNVSEGRIRREMKRSKTKNYWNLRRLPRQTRNYIPSFIAVATIASQPEKYGFRSPVLQAWQYDEIELTRQSSIDVIAKAAGVSEATILDLNTELLNWVTPHTGTYTLRLPKGTALNFRDTFSKLPDDQLITKLIHSVRNGESLSQIARKFGASINQIMRVNNISNPNRIWPGQKLDIPTNMSSKSYNALIARNSKRGRSYAKAPSDASQRQRITYRVRKGDTPSEIAEKHGVGLSKLRAWNGLGRRSFIYPNQNLSIWLPRGRSITVVDKNAETHTVRRGDTVADISKAYGVSINTVLTQNNLTKRSIIYPGQKLVIRGVTSVSTGSNAAKPPDVNVAKITTPQPENLSGKQKIIHTVRRGDVIATIASRNGVRSLDVLKWNSLSARSVIYPGDKIVLYVDEIPQAVSGDDSFVDYTVKSGDALWEIAQKFNTSVAAIKRANGKRSSRIYPGDKLRIPTGQKNPSRQ